MEARRAQVGTLAFIQKVVALRVYCEERATTARMGLPRGQQLRPASRPPRGRSFLPGLEVGLQAPRSAGWLHLLQAPQPLLGAFCHLGPPSLSQQCTASLSLPRGQASALVHPPPPIFPRSFPTSEEAALQPRFLNTCPSVGDTHQIRFTRAAPGDRSQMHVESQGPLDTRTGPKCLSGLSAGLLVSGIP